MTGKKELKKNIKKLQIVQAAEEISQIKPYKDIGMNEIAESAGVTKKTVYKHFPSKLALFVSIYENYLQKLHERMFAVSSQSLLPEEGLKQLLVTLFNFTRENEKLMRLFWALESEEMDGSIPIELSNRINIWNKAIVDTMARVLQQGAKDHTIKTYEPEMVFHLFSAVNKGIFVHTNKEKRFNINDINPQQLFDFFCTFILADLFHPPE